MGGRGVKTQPLTTLMLMLVESWPWGRRLFVPVQPHTDQQTWPGQQQLPFLLLLLPSRSPQPAVTPRISPHLPSVLPPTERIPRQLLMAWQAQASRYTTPAMAAPVPAHLPPTSQGLLVPPQPAQHYPVTYHLGQGSVWQGVPGTLGQLLQLPQGMQLQQVPQVVQLSPGVQLGQGVQQVQLPQGVQLVQVPQGVQLPHGPAAFAPSYPWGQQLLMGTTVAPPQPMGHGPWTMVQGQPLFPAGSYQLPIPARPGAPTARGPVARQARSRPAHRTLPDTTKEPAEASSRDGVAVELGLPTASPHQPALAAPGDPTAVTTKAALGSPGDLPQQEPATCTRAAEELDPDTVADSSSTWLEATFAGDGVPEVADSPDLASFLCELPDLSGAENTSPGEQEAAVALEDGEDTSHVPSAPTFLSEPPDLSDLRELDGFWEQVAEITCSQDQVALAQLGGSGDASFTTHGSGVTAEVLEELPDLPKAEGACMEDPVTGEMLLCGDTTFPDGPDSQASSTPVTGDFWEHGATGDSLEHHLAAAMMGDTDPFWGVMASPSPAPQGTQDAGVTDLSPWLQRDSLQSAEQSSPESPEEPPEDGPLASPWRDPMTDSLESPLLSPLQEPLHSPLASPPPAPQPQPSSMDLLMEELKRRQLRVLLTRLPLPPGTVTCRGLPGPGAAGPRKTKRPAPVRAPKGRDTAPRHTIPRKRRRT